MTTYNKFIQQCIDGEFDNVKLSLSDPNFDPTKYDQQVLYTVMMNNQKNLFILLVNDKRFDLTLASNELLGASLTFHEQGNSFYTKFLLRKKEIIQTITENDKLAIKEHTDIVDIINKRKKRMISKKIKVF